ncbi:MAG TPA: hypothetical protein HA362_00375 [Nanoarchaeota archaeon]|nr:hypothetical protein [Nanoarchaeota archaeon]
MADIFDADIVCDACKTRAVKGELFKDGFRIRAWRCPKCNKVWPHPLDMSQYEDFRRLKQRDFEVKLRQVGNSWSVSIPKEIIQFEAVKATKVVRLSLDNPGKVSISFTQIKRIINKSGGGQ